MISGRKPKNQSCVDAGICVFRRSTIYPRAAGEAHKFLYSTRIGAGLQIRGEGESAGERDDSSGQRTSALKFWSKDPKSLIEFRSGYWQYVPDERGIRFLTSYGTSSFSAPVDEY